MSQTIALSEVARLPSDGDNVAIATRQLNAGTVVTTDNAELTLDHTVMEGHRFAVQAIAAGQPLLSWGMPFGRAIRPIAPGEYVCNPKILNTLKHREIDFSLPATANFEDEIRPYLLNKADFKPGEQVSLGAAETGQFFRGYARAHARGVGTRNMLVVLGTTSLSASFVRSLEARFESQTGEFPNVDGVVAVAHTEGGGQTEPNNRDLLLRTLAGFMVHPNVGAVLAVDYGTEVVNNKTLESFMRENGYPLDNLVHSFFTINQDFQSALALATTQIEAWLPQVNAFERTEQPASELKIALQCGGSDAFSGISGNPLAGWVAKATVKNGGCANLAETDELIGAEPYVLKNVRDLNTAERFLHKIAAFKERASWHGHSAEGNPSGGNQYRGLYNIVLKSIGAARKKDPDVRLDYVIDYAEPMDKPGYYFMDSPGNDLESIAGQVASGSNLILFITGNGSITNFPFVPTLKFVTTSGRWKMLANEMDVNAGRYLDGESMDSLGAEIFDLALAIASGQQSLGEQAGHAQVSIWRNWQQRGPGQVEKILNAAKPTGEALAIQPATPPQRDYHAFPSSRGPVADRVGLVVPTSLCSGQVARMLAEKLNRQFTDSSLTRFVALVHTEGCGAAAGYSQNLYLRTVRGHIDHPLVAKTLLIEHGCEQTHNDAMRGYLSDNGIAADELGWASVQLDGGIMDVLEKGADWFRTQSDDGPAPARAVAPLSALRLGITANGSIDPISGEAIALLARWVVSAGGTVVVAENASTWADQGFHEQLLAQPMMPTLGYGDAPSKPGLHVMEMPTDHAVESVTGLAASGVEVIINAQSGAPLQGHPLVPLLQISADPATIQQFGADLDLRLDSAQTPENIANAILDRVLAVLSGTYQTRQLTEGNTDFQLTRGLLGLSL